MKRIGLYRVDLRWFAIIILLITSVVLRAQTFQGTLLYQFQSEITDKSLLKKLDDRGIKNRSGENSLRNFFISDSIIVSIARTEYDELLYKESFTEIEAVVDFPSGKRLPLDAGLQEQPVVLVNAKQGQKIIAGYNCSRFDFQSVSGSLRVEAWITSELPVVSCCQSGSCPYFNKFIFPQGIALEKKIFYKSAVHQWTVQKIELNSFSKDEIHSIFDSTW